MKKSSGNIVTRYSWIQIVVDQTIASALRNDAVSSARNREAPERF